MYIRPKLKPANLNTPGIAFFIMNKDSLREMPSGKLQLRKTVVLVQVPPKQPKQIMGNMQYLVSHVTSTTVLQKAGGTIIIY